MGIQGKHACLGFSLGTRFRTAARLAYLVHRTTFSPVELTLMFLAHTVASAALGTTSSPRKETAHSRPPATRGSFGPWKRSLGDEPSVAFGSAAGRGSRPAPEASASARRPPFVPAGGALDGEPHVSLPLGLTFAEVVRLSAPLSWRSGSEGARGSSGRPGRRTSVCEHFSIAGEPEPKVLAFSGSETSFPRPEERSSSRRPCPA